jgi:hypothetical protein
MGKDKVSGWIFEDQLFVLKSPDFVNDRILVIRAGMPGRVLILEPRVVCPVEKSMDFIHHAAERMPANSSFQPQSVETGQVSHPVSKRTGSCLSNHPDFDTIESLHSSLPFQPLSPCLPKGRPGRGEDLIKTVF